MRKVEKVFLAPWKKKKIEDLFVFVLNGPKSPSPKTPGKTIPEMVSQHL